MTSEEFERMTMLLEQLGEERGAMNPRSQEFFDQQVERFKQYGDRTFLSPKQKSWLESLYEEHVGPLDQLGGVHLSAPDTDDDLDIPF